MSSHEHHVKFVSCPLCGSRKISNSHGRCIDYLSREKFLLVSCKRCRCSFTKLATSNANGNYYGTNYYNSRSGKFTRLVEKLFRFNHRRNARYLTNNYPANRILEIGCGRGYLLRALKKTGTEVYCLESPEAADWILANQDIHMMTANEQDDACWPFESDFFQLIIYWHVLEHLSDPVASLREATRCLQPGGTICISVPNVTSWQARLHLPTWFHLDVPRHLFHFSQQGICMLLKAHGFTIIQMEPGDRIQNLYGWLQSIANLFTPWAPNAFYRLLQGGAPLRSVNILALSTQLITSWIWIPLGFLGFLAEEFFRNYGSITLYAQKPLPRPSATTNTI